MVKHSFGGEWTRIKLERLESYLKIYTTALKNQPFTLHYVDAFAGTGQRDDDDLSSDPLLELEVLRGSVRRALDCKDVFHEYHFNDLKLEHVQALEELRAEYPDKVIHITQLDANEFVTRFCRRLRGRDRAVIFLDPYSTAVNWSTLEVIASTQKVDLWMLFPISTLLRLLPQDGPREEWRPCIERLLGTSEWKNACYAPSQPLVDDLFGEQEVRSQRSDYEAIIQFVTMRLREIFAHVEEPTRLTRNAGVLFLFYFSVSNPKAKALAAKLARVTQPKR
ncbi:MULTISPECIES: three-Cys-motif partner protein TcmP [Pseudomonas]|nr:MULTISPECIES: three-Cys-motif partner protein TcmP [Pseudomonas]MBJ7560073.1 three-Cys-motif partner protein TcmP [Pseudomonas sp. P20]MBJ7566713.1 three-Cys-motif partner protein TcmP [Pseudomonas sp. P22]MBM0727247.1 three-Cys-motif partner protein TcmP [Pseudomonas aeruginosa]MBM2511193.1 three-Cys-motif partner protein TcmP [Pseudomonas aeruginosa]MBM2527486.1 three-Cys-motif partner protein TcmP [Pseudomonas aeruginosa]